MRVDVEQIRLSEYLTGEKTGPEEREKSRPTGLDG